MHTLGLGMHIITYVYNKLIIYVCPTYVDLVDLVRIKNLISI